jgi:hypothetical protein
VLTNFKYGFARIVGSFSRAPRQEQRGRRHRPEKRYRKEIAKQGPPEVSVEDWKSVRREGDEVNQTIQLIDKPNCRTNAPLGVPSGGFVGVLYRRRVEPDRPLHQGFDRARS